MSEAGLNEWVGGKRSVVALFKPRRSPHEQILTHKNGRADRDMDYWVRATSIPSIQRDYMCYYHYKFLRPVVIRVDFTAQ